MSAATSNERFVIGEIVAIHGLYGEVRVQPLTDFPERFAELKQLWVRMPKGQAVRYTVNSVKRHETKSLMILGLGGLKDRQSAAKLIGGILEIDAEDVVELPQDTYFEHDILGLQVVTTDGRDLGRIEDILRTGANDVYVTPVCLIPAIADVVKSIDIAGGKVVIEPIPGLLEEEE